MENKVWVVTSGSYSDYQIDGIFSTQEKADAFVAERNTIGPSNLNVGEWTLDEHVGEVMRPVYRAEVDLKTGAVKPGWTDGRMVSPNARYVPPADQSLVDVGSAFADSAVSMEHAIKLAVETRQAWLREQGMKEQKNAEIVASIKSDVREYRARGGT